MNGDVGDAAAFCAGLPRPVRAAYEAGPTGYGLARELAKRRVECVVAAPSKIPRASGDRVKTDRRDAELLVRLLLAGKLHAVRVPGLEEEALRDLVRAREAVRVDLMRCRHRLSKLLLRHAIRFDDGPAWTQRHRDWLAMITLPWPAAQATMLDAHGAIDALAHRRDQLEREIVALVPGSPWVVHVGRLRCLRGVDTLTAVGLCAEVGDFERFARAEQLMSYVGLVPCESTTGQQRRLGSITKTGSGHARRLLVEAAWHYRPRPHIDTPRSHRGPYDHRAGTPSAPATAPIPKQKGRRGAAAPQGAAALAETTRVMSLRAEVDGAGRPAGGRRSGTRATLERGAHAGALVADRGRHRPVGGDPVELEPDDRDENERDEEDVQEDDEGGGHVVSLSRFRGQVVSQDHDRGRAKEHRELNVGPT